MNRTDVTPICGPPRQVALRLACFALTLATAGSAALAQWVEFNDETNPRSAVANELFAGDGEEKDYAWGDIDLDGDIDLIIVRKQPFTSPGKRVNVVLINDGGVLTDRTSDFAVDSDIPGDQGFLTPTNDRDVALADLNNDGWLDMVTTTAISSGDPKHIGYPRIYMNQCCAVGGCGASSCSTGAWQGFRYEDARMPVMLTDSGAAGFNPCFCSVSAGDVSGDGYADLYFVDYDTSCDGSGGASDFNDKLLLNQGALNPGFFTDVTETNFVGGASGFPVSAFGASGGIAKLNEDDVNDILKQFASFVGIAFNDPLNEGMFATDNSPHAGSTYFVTFGDLNNDDKMDLVTAEDGQDRYLLNQGDGVDDVADFISFAFSYAHGGVGGPSGDDGFGGNALVADLDLDGWQDVVITDADVDVGGCTRRTHIFRNLAGDPGDSVILQEQTDGTGCETFLGNPASCLVATIPSDKLEGTHDVAVFDINGDSFEDLVVGRCGSTEIYMNVPPAPPSGGVPDGNGVPGTLLTVDRSGDQITLTWGASCTVDDTDYSVYEGALPSVDFRDHAPRACSTGGATTITLSQGIGPQSSYFLVAPRNDFFQGSAGTGSSGFPRNLGNAPCVPQSTGPCQ